MTGEFPDPFDPVIAGQGEGLTVVLLLGNVNACQGVVPTVLKEVDLAATCSVNLGLGFVPAGRDTGACLATQPVEPGRPYSRSRAGPRAREQPALGR